MRKGFQPKGERRSGKIYILAYFFPIIASVVVVLVNMVILWRVFWGDVPLSTDQAQTLCLSDIISIFGIAVSVWVGLSIASAIDRGKLRGLEEAINAVNKTLDATYEAAKNNLLSDLRVDAELPISHWFAKQVEATEISEGEVFRQIREEERLYTQIRSIKYTEDKAELFKDLEASHQEIIKWVKQNVKDESISQMMRIRAMEVKFLLAYHKKGIDAIYGFKEAVEFYRKPKNDILIEHWSLSEMVTIDSVKDFKRQVDTLRDDEAEILAYFLNFLGESYSKIVHMAYDGHIPLNNDDAIFKACAVRLCHFATIASEKCGRRRETYYRNYGCAIERAAYGSPNETALVEAITQYRKAFQIDNGNPKVLHCLVSAYNKWFELLMDWDRNKISSILDVRVPPTKRKHIIKVLRQQSWAQKLYLNCCPGEKSAYVMAALYCRNDYLVYRSPDRIKDLGSYIYALRICGGGGDAYIDGIKVCTEENIPYKEVLLCLKK